MTFKIFLITLFWKQNKYHKHGVFMHTVKVCLQAIRGDIKFLPAAICHDFGKPFVAYQKEEDIINNEYSFTDHEEESYQIIKNWPFLSEWTKLIVRHHYLIRSMSKEKTRNPELYKSKKEIWDSLSDDMKSDLAVFLKMDDGGKM